MQKILFTQSIVFALLFAHVSSANELQGASASLMAMGKLDEAPETFRALMTELYFECAQAKDKASCITLSENKMCEWKPLRRVIEKGHMLDLRLWPPRISTEVDSIKYVDDPHCGIDMTLLYAKGGMGSKAIKTFCSLAATGLMWGFYLQADYPSRFYLWLAVIVSGLSGHWFYDLTGDLNYLSIESEIHRDAAARKALGSMYVPR